MFDYKQRDAFIKLLTQAKTRAEKEIESDYSFNSRVESEIAPKLAEEYGASDLLKNVSRLSKELDLAKTALGKIGFSCNDDGTPSVDYDAPKPLCDAVDAVKRSAKQEREKGLKKYDLAIVAVLASEDVKEAKKIVEGLLN